MAPLKLAEIAEKRYPIQRGSTSQQIIIQEMLRAAFIAGAEMDRWISVKEQYEKNRESEDASTRICAMCRALGYSEPYYGQMALHGVHHLIHWDDVETVAKWLIEKGFDIVKPLPSPPPNP